MRIEFLGTGTSTGVPTIGCGCEVCRSADPRDNRLRSSVCVTVGGKNILIDCGPDFRQQILRSGIDRIDAVLITHEHYDHISAIDELRSFSKESPVPLYAEPNVLEVITEHFFYCFNKHPYSGVAHLQLHALDDLRPFTVQGIEVVPIRVMHGALPIVGFRIGRFAYITDMLTLPESEYAKLAGLEILVINALRHQPHATHQTLADALAVIERLAPERAYLTHICHHMGFQAEEEKKLPAGVAFAYDGLVLHTRD